MLFAHMVCPISSEVVFWEEVQRCVANGAGNEVCGPAQPVSSQVERDPLAKGRAVSARRWFTIEKLAGPMRGEEAAPAAAPGCDQAPQQAADDTHPAAPKRDGHAAKADIGRDSEQDMGVSGPRSRALPCAAARGSGRPGSGGCPPRAQRQPTSR